MILTDQPAARNEFDSVFMRYIAPGALGGIKLSTWLRLLVRHRGRISFMYTGRAAAITAAASINSLGAAREAICFGRAIRRAEIQPPIFVVGVWRSGTTHLHNLLCCDDRFAYPNQFQVMNPHVFLGYEDWLPQVIGRFLPKTRPQDNVALAISSPQEDEFAIAALAGSGPGLDWVFPQAAGHYERFVDMQAVPASQRQRWERAMLWFIRKLSYRYGRPLVLKSPMHTARLPLLQRMFPDARFVYIHRHPYEVYASSRHLVRASLPLCALQRYDVDAMCERMVPLYRTLTQSYLAARDTVAPNRLVEIRYEDLNASPISTLESVYRQLELPSFEEVRPRMAAYLQRLGEYQRNRYPRLRPELARRLQVQWREAFQAWHYAA